MEYKLLDHLANVMKVDYLSELKIKGNVKEFTELIESIHDDEYTLEDWQDACVYLLNNDARINTVAEAKGRILKWLTL